MWGKQGHEMLRGQSCCRIRVQEPSSSACKGGVSRRAAAVLLRAGTGRLFLLGWGEGGRAGGKGKSWGQGKSWVFCPWAGNGGSGEKSVGWKKPQGVTTTKV